MQNTIDNIYNKFVEIEETIQALAITTGIFKEHFDRDSEKEIHHIMLSIYQNIEQLDAKVQDALSDFDEYLVRKE